MMNILNMKSFSSIIMSLYSGRPDWKVCIVQPRSRLRSFGANARPGAQILKILSSGAQFRNVARQKMILRNFEARAQQL